MLRVGLLLGGLALLGAAPEDQKGLTPGKLSQRLAAEPKGDEADKLADEVRAWFGKDNLLKGAAPKINGLEVAWAIESPGVSVAPRVVSIDGSFSLSLDPVEQDRHLRGHRPPARGHGNPLGPYESPAGGSSQLLDAPASQAAAARPAPTAAGGLPPPHPDSLPRSDVPQGQAHPEGTLEEQDLRGTPPATGGSTWGEEGGGGGGGKGGSGGGGGREGGGGGGGGGQGERGGMGGGYRGEGGEEKSERGMGKRR